MKTQGLSGAVRIEVLLEDDRNFAPGQAVILVDKVADRDLEIEFFRRQHGRCILKLQTIDSIEDAEKIVGATIAIRKTDLAAPAEGSFYTFELKGCAVFERNEFIGTITDVLESGGVEILKVDRDDEETLIPFAQSYLKKIDLELRRVEVDLPEGLRDINK